MRNSAKPEPNLQPGVAPTLRAAQTVRALEERVQALKEQAWRVKARVGMLKEAVLGGGVGARASIVHENKMGGSFRLVKLVYAMDGQQVFSRADDSGKLNDLKTIDILSGPIAPGNHTISVIMLYRGHGYGEQHRARVHLLDEPVGEAVDHEGSTGSPRTSSTTPYSVLRVTESRARPATRPSRSMKTKLGMAIGGNVPWKASSVVPSGSKMLS